MLWHYCCYYVFLLCLLYLYALFYSSIAQRYDLCLLNMRADGTALGTGGICPPQIHSDPPTLSLHKATNIAGKTGFMFR